MAYADEVLADTPLAYWKLDEAAGAFADSSGNGKTLTISGGVTRDVAGAFGASRGVTLDGSTAFLQSNQTLNHDKFSIELWYKGTDNNGVLASSRVGAGSITMGLGQPPVGGANVGGRVDIGYDASGKWIGVQTSAAVVNDGNWHHIVGVWNGTAGSGIVTGQFAIYIDGVAVAVTGSSFSSQNAPASSGTDGYKFGYSNGGWPSNAYAAGTIDEIALYGKALTATRVQAHFAASVAAAPITVAGETATVTVTALDGRPITPVRVVGEAADVAVTALDGTPVSGVPPVKVAGETADITVTALDGTPVIGTAPPPVIEVGTQRRNLGTSTRRRTGEGFVEIRVPVAPEPPSIRRAPIRVNVDTLPAPSFDASGLTQAMSSTPVRGDDWGRPRVVVSHRDVTFLRDKAALVLDYQLLDPYGYGPATLKFPQISEWEQLDFGTGSLSWLHKNAPVRIERIHAGDRELKWFGHIDAFDWDEDGTLLCDCSGEVQGRMDKTIRTQRLIRIVRDAGFMARIALSQPSKSYRLKGSAEDWSRTGTPMENTGGGMGTNLAFLDYLLANMVDEDLNQWTILPTEEDPRTFDLQRRDTTTVHATVYLGAQGVKQRLRDDQMEQPTRLFGEGVAPSGARWRGAVYPNLGPEVVPDYPFTDGRTFGAVGLTDADTDTGVGVMLLEDELWGSGLLDLDLREGTWTIRTTEAVEEVQRRANLPVTGQVDLATWRAVFGDGADKQRMTQAEIRPLAWDPRTEPWLLSPNGSKLGRNPDHDRRVPRIERDTSFGEGVRKRKAAKWLRRERRRADQVNFRGTISLTTDVLAGEHTFGEPGTPMSRLQLKAGMNILVKRFGSTRGILAHIAGARPSGFSADEVSVELLVDTQFRDALTLQEMLERDKAARRDPARRWLSQHRRSNIPSDSMIPWDSEAGAGRVPRTPLTGGQWNVIRVIGGQSGEVQRIELHTRDERAEFYCAVFAKRIGAGQLNAQVGDPSQVGADGDLVWNQNSVADMLSGVESDEDRKKRRDELRRKDRQKHPDATEADREERVADAFALLYDQRVGVYVGGTPGGPLGYSPRKKNDENGDRTEHPVSGDWRDDAGFSYWTIGLGGPYLYLAIYPDRDCTVHGRLYAQLSEGV